MIIAVMRRALDGLQVHADEWSERCTTTIENAGGYVVVLSSVLASRAITLVSCYLADLTGPTSVSHLRLAPGQPPHVAQRVLAGLPGQTHARACLLDHTAQLRDVLGEAAGRRGRRRRAHQRDARAGRARLDRRARLALNQA